MNSRDLQAALLELAGRELISSAEFERARDVRIGLLGITMAPGKTSRPADGGMGIGPHRGAWRVSVRLLVRPGVGRVF